MWVYVVYGTRSASIARVARSVATAVGWSKEYEARAAADITPSEIRGPGLVFLGCASGGSELDRTIRKFLDRLPGRVMGEVVWAVFDTRTTPHPAVAGAGIRRLRRAVEHRGGKLLVNPQSFYSNDETQGVLAFGELDRARSWASSAIGAAVRRYGDPTVRSGALSGYSVRSQWEPLTTVAPT